MTFLKAIPIKVLALIIPCYNPPKGWVKKLEIFTIDLQKSFPELKIQTTIVNDGSTSGFEMEEINEIEKNTEIRILQNEINSGKGFSIRKGVAHAEADFYIYTDVDLPYTLKSCISIINKLLQGNDVVAGIRNQTYYKNIPAARVVISKSLKGLMKVFVSLPTTDTQCGLKGFNQKGKEVFLKTKTNRFLFDMEFIRLAGKAKLKFAMQEVELRQGVSFTHMNNRVLLHEAFTFIKLLLK
ncbi:MAG: glycosyltransferase family 2 protein [Bacteroidetes bacterium]|nr:glycosyltransferase family 2 protein [Bacteroidota bacterium]